MNAAKTRLPKAAEVYEAVTGADTASKSKGVYTVRRGFYYRHGRTADDLVADVKAVYPEAKILDSGEVWKPFRGGTSVAKSSHWYVKFTL